MLRHNQRMLGVEASNIRIRNTVKLCSRLRVKNIVFATDFPGVDFLQQAALLFFGGGATLPQLLQTATIPDLSGRLRYLVDEGTKLLVELI